MRLLRDLTEKSVNLSTLATFNIRLLLVFGEQDQKTKLVQLVRKKFMITEEKLGKMTNFFDETISLPEPKFYPRIYGDCNSS